MSLTVFGYVVLFTLLLAGAAAAVEWGTQGRVATRRIWTTAIVFAMLAPPVAIALHAITQRAAQSQVTAAQTPLALAAVVVNAGADGAQRTPMWQRVGVSIIALTSRLARRVAPVAVAVWAFLSLTMLGWLAIGALRWRRTRRAWRRTTLDGVDVDISRSTGPAVLGFVSHRIVLPSWATTMQPEHRRLVLAHECEHISAHDPERLALGLAALVLMPWNIGLWWCAARLRRAIEIDCDARVLRRFPSAKEYGYVLLEVAARGRNTGPLAIPMVGLLHLPSELEQRLRAMTRARALGYRSAICGGVAAMIAVVGAFAAPIPSLQSPAGSHAVPAATDGSSAAIARIPDFARVSDTVPKRARATDTLSRRQRDSLRVLIAEMTARAAAVNQARARVESTQVELYKRRFELNAEKSRLHLLQSKSPLNTSQTYFEYQVEKPAIARPDSPAPIYPAALRSAHVEGEVDAEFVVDTTGRVVPWSVTLTKSTNKAFADAVREALPKMRFVPAEVGGVRVQQVVQQPFTFALSAR